MKKAMSRPDIALAFAFMALLPAAVAGKLPAGLAAGREH